MGGFVAPGPGGARVLVGVAHRGWGDVVVDCGDLGEEAEHGHAVDGGEWFQEALLDALDGGLDALREVFALRGQADQLYAAVVGAGGSADPGFGDEAFEDVAEG